VQGIERDDAVRNLEFAKQLLRGGDLVGFLCDVDVRQDQSGVGVESMQQLGGLAVAEIVEASPQRLPIQRDGASRWIGCGIPQTSGVAAEHLLDWLRIEALQDVADGGMGRGALPARPKATFNRRRCTLIKVSTERKELPPVTTARMENSRTHGSL
jgi:hypothetical protein